MEDNNIFDEDDALDYVIFEEHEQRDKQPSGRSGCLSMLLCLSTPGMTTCYVIAKLIS